MAEKSTPVDLSDLNGHWTSPGTGDAGDGLDGRDSNSPLSVSRGKADPTNINESPVKTTLRA